MIAPYVADQVVVPPLVVFGCLALVAWYYAKLQTDRLETWQISSSSHSSFLVTFLPETRDHKLPDSILDGEILGDGDTLYSWLLEVFAARQHKRMTKRENGTKLTEI